MSKELFIVVGIPNSGKTTWVSKNYSGDNTKIVDETSYDKFYKDRKVQESEFFNSLDWLGSQVKLLMESSTERIVVIPYQCRPDRWVETLTLAKTHGYTVNVAKPTHGSLFYYNSKLGTNQEQINWVQRATVNRYPKYNKDKKKSDDEDEVKENFNLFSNIITEYQSACAFLLQNRSIGNDPEKYLQVIESQFKPVMVKIQQQRTAIKAKAAKEAAKEAEKAEKAAKFAKEAEEKSQKAAIKEAQEYIIKVEVDEVETDIMQSIPTEMTISA